MSSTPADLVLFAGRFHPLLVHLPIGGLVLLGFLELAARFSRFKTAAQSRQLILALTAAGAVISALCGWLLSQSGDYDHQLVRYHKWAGIGLAAACLVTAGLSRCPGRWSYRLSLFGTLALLVVASHLGASLTHGRDFLTRYAPAPLRSLIGGEAAGEPTGTMQPEVFATTVQPILLKRCSACHGPEKHKGGLRLDSLAGLLRGGENGPVVIPGHAAESPMIRRLLLPIDNDDHMPPAEKPQPAAAEIEVVKRWIDSAGPGEGPSTVNTQQAPAKASAAGS